MNKTNKFSPEIRERAVRMDQFIDQHRDRFGVEPICMALQVAPSRYWREAARRRNPALCPARHQRDAALVPEIERV